jgi:anti-sigma factor RsiW
MHASSELLVELVDVELGGLDAQWIVPHVGRCIACAAALAEVRETRDWFARLLRRIDAAEPPEWTLAHEMLTALAARA